METEDSTGDRVIGRIPRDGIIRVEMRLTWHDGETVTVDHEPIAGYWRFAVSASAWYRRNSSDCHMAGQCREIVAKVGTELSARIGRLWDWHLNDMTARCAHQRISEGNSTPCPVTGYRYGSAWLVRVIPDDVLAEIRATIAELNTLPRNLEAPLPRGKKVTPWTR